MDENYKKEKIMNLKKQKKYDEIYIEFGRKEYKKHTPLKYRNKDLKKLKKEGKYEDIFNKYGEATYNNLLENAMYEEIKENQGQTKAFLWNMKRKIKKVVVDLGLTFFGISALLPAMNTSTIKQNEVKYEKEIEDYDTKIKKYAKQVKDLNLNDVQVCMKVMDDMWKQIKGYKEPELDIEGFFELDLATEEGYGVCRNMASDVARKLNEINPKYNARTIIVTINEDGIYEISNIERNIVEENETTNVTEEREENETTNATEEREENKKIDIFGNHMVTLVDIPKDNLILVIDPTNPGLGIYQDGKITMLNTTAENEKKFVPKKFSTAVLLAEGYKDTINVMEDYINSFKKSNLTMEEIEEKYGIKGQNQALKEVRELVEKEKSDKKLANKDLTKEEFKERLKVGDLETQNIEKNLNNNIKKEMTR